MRSALAVITLLTLVGCGAERARPPGTRGPPRADAGASARDAGAGPGRDAGPAADGGAPGRDAGTPPRDGGAPGRDAGVADAGGRGVVCPRASGMSGVGRRWTQRSTAAYEAQVGFATTIESEIVRDTDHGSYREILVDGVQTSQGTLSSGQSYFSVTRSTATYRCDAQGLLLVSHTSQTQQMVDGSPTETTSNVTYSPPLLRLPVSLQVGASGSGTTAQRSFGESAGQPFDTTTNLSVTWTVVGRASVSTPAGTFPDAWQVRSEWPSYTSVDHYVDDVGYVPVESFELVSYD